MRPIPAKLRDELAADPFYKRCCITGALATNTKVDWHHNMTWQGRQLQEKWAILPLEKDVHDNIVRYKEKCDWIMLNRATEDDLRRYSKAENLMRKRDILNQKYGRYRQNNPAPLC